MTYLALSLAAFILLATVFWLSSPWRTKERTFTARIEDLPLFLSVVSTAKLGERKLRIRIYRRVPYLELTLNSDCVLIDLTLLTARQRKAKEDLLALGEALGPTSQITTEEDGSETIRISLPVSPMLAAPTIERAFSDLMGAPSERKVEFTTFLNYSDNQVIWSQLFGGAPGSDNPRMATTKDMLPNTAAKAHRGCLGQLAGWLLWPVPFLLVYGNFGLLPATWTLLGTIALSWLLFHRNVDHSDRTSVQKVISWTRAVTPALASITIATEDPTYLQVAPTITLSVGALCLWVCLLTGRWELILPDAAKSFVTTPVGKLMLYSVAALTAVGAALNEHLRATVPLDTWVWFFAFLRFEFFVAFLVLAFPAILFLNGSSTETRDT